MVWIESSPELLRRDGRGRDSGKKGRKGERGSVGGDTDVRVPHVSGWKKKENSSLGAGKWDRGLSERGLGGLGLCLRARRKEGRGLVGWATLQAWLVFLK